MDVNLKVVTCEVGEVVVAELSGRITLGEGSVVFRDAVKDLLAKGHRTIHLDLSEVSYIDSSGIGELAAAFVGVQRAGGELKLIALSDRVRALLGQVTGDDDAEAVCC
jgi:anti-sigma B factor antagonist